MKKMMSATTKPIIEDTTALWLTIRSKKVLQYLSKVFVAKQYVTNLVILPRLIKKLISIMPMAITKKMTPIPLIIINLGLLNISETYFFERLCFVYN